jgi:hypothetical protein
MALFIKILFFLSYLNHAIAEENDLCKYFKYCGGSSRKSSQSIPSASAAGSLNPSNISSVKGIGFETIYQPGNPLVFDFVTGNGKIGALVTLGLENSFFGNRPIEIDDILYDRKINELQYKNKKLGLGIGASLIDKNKIGLDVGVSFKRNPDIKNINYGVGLSARLAFLNFGAYLYQDDVLVSLGNYLNPYTGIAYSTTYLSSTYQEKFSVATYTVGAKISQFSLDMGIIKTKYNFYTDNTLIYLYSGSYSMGKWLFNLAYRKEQTPNLYYFNHSMFIQREKTDIYYGVEYLMNSHFVFGLQYNNFLLNELSATMTLFL